MEHQVRSIFERELSQMNWSGGMSKQHIVQHFSMAPTLRDMLRAQLPDKNFTSDKDVLGAIPHTAWEQLDKVMTHGSPESNYLKSRAANFDTYGETPGFGHLPPEQHEAPR